MDFKKKIADNKGGNESSTGFSNKRGFYIVLVMSVGIIVGTAVLVTTYNVTSSTEFNLDKIIPEEISDEVIENTKGKQSVESSVNTNHNISSRKNMMSSKNTIKENTNVDSKKSIKDTEAENKDFKKDDIKENNKYENIEIDDGSEIDKNKDIKLDNDLKNNEHKKAKTDTDFETRNNKALDENIKMSNGKQKAKNNPKETRKEKETNTLNTKMVLPVYGEVTSDYSQDKLVFSKTLNEWRTHRGLDIEASIGTPVRAAGNGVISEIKNDPGYGFTVVVDHNDGIKTVYSNMAKSEMVGLNQVVEQGDVIGCVGNTAAFESQEKCHLHLEVLKNGKNVNPREYFY